MLPDHYHFKLFATCIPVKGARRSVICDLERRGLEFIPNSLYDLLKKHESHTIGQIKAHYGKENEATIEEYFQFLIKKEYLFLCEEKELARFPDLNLSWEVPNQIENAIIDSTADSQHDFGSLFGQLAELGCIAVQIRNFFPEKWNTIKEMLQLLKQSRIESIEIITGYSEEFTAPKIAELARQFPRLSALTLHSAPFAHALHFDHEYLAFKCTEKIIDSHAHCGLVAPRFFSVNPDSFLESQHHNSCLNHKLSIDAGGQIKNCPSLQASFGNARDVSLHSALNQAGFKKYWSVSKTQIEVCRDCEFRHICTDCRAFVENPENEFSKPLKCGYDPYTNEWREWSEHPMKKRAIRHYGLEDLKYSDYQH